MKFNQVIYFIFPEIRIFDKIHFVFPQKFHEAQRDIFITISKFSVNKSFYAIHRIFLLSNACTVLFLRRGGCRRVRGRRNIGLKGRREYRGIRHSVRFLYSGSILLRDILHGRGDRWFQYSRRSRSFPCIRSLCSEVRSGSLLSIILFPFYVPLFLFFSSIAQLTGQLYVMLNLNM